MSIFFWVVLVVAVLLLLLSFRPKPAVKPLDEASRAEVERLALAGRHIDAIKAYRQATHASLKDAKAAVEQLERR